MVAAKEDVGLVRVTRGEGGEELEDFASPRAAVAVVAEEDNEGSLEGGGANRGLEVGPKGLQFGKVAMDVSDAEHRPRRRPLDGVDGTGFSHLGKTIQEK